MNWGMSGSSDADGGILRLKFEASGAYIMLMDESELLYGELYYECRIVSFFDTLGWRQQIQEAGDDPRRIARLASVPRLFSSAVMEMAKRAEGAQMTAFSDAVIVSVPYDADRLLWNLQGLATVQLGLALSGFWVRGATTVGHLVPAFAGG
jgi:hypothetical protein